MGFHLFINSIVAFQIPASNSQNGSIAYTNRHFSKVLGTSKILLESGFPNVHQYPDISYVPPRVKVSFLLLLFSLKPHPPMIQRPVAFCH